MYLSTHPPFHVCTYSSLNEYSHKKPQQLLVDTLGDISLYIFTSLMAFDCFLFLTSSSKHEQQFPNCSSDMDSYFKTSMIFFFSATSLVQISKIPCCILKAYQLIGKELSTNDKLMSGTFIGYETTFFKIIIFYYFIIFCSSHISELY